LSVAALAVVVTQKAAATDVPATLMMNTVRAATLIAAGQMAVSGTISTRVAALAEGVLKTMFLSKVKTASVILFVGAMLLFGSALLMVSTLKAEHANEPAQTAAVPDEKAHDAQELVTYSGRVLGPDGQPVTGAKLYMTLS